MPKLTILNTGETIEISSDETILRQLVERRMPIRHNCKGRARCATCRCRVVSGLEHFSAPNEFERFVLALKEVKEPEIRLACQNKICGDAAIEFVNELPFEERPWEKDGTYQLPHWSDEEIGHPDMKLKGE
ncbi:MAG: (2Fe-2S)-binding protein [bacterium]|jgi:ferredoxin